MPNATAELDHIQHLRTLIALPYLSPLTRDMEEGWHKLAPEVFVPPQKGWTQDCMDTAVQVVRQFPVDELRADPLGDDLLTAEDRETVVRAPLADAAHRADPLGNLSYDLTARNFNPVMAMAASTVIAEAEVLVEVGDLPPDAIVTPGVLVDLLVESR